jgi:hypothetical protein
MLEYFSQAGICSLAIEPLSPAGKPSSSLEEGGFLVYISRALKILEAAYVLSHAPHDHELARLSGTLRSELASVIDSAAGATKDHQLERHLQLRSEAFKDGQFDAARRYSATHTLPIELILGPVPSWRTHGAKTGLSGIIAVPVQNVMAGKTAEVDAEVESIARQLLVDQGLGSLERSFESPIYSICDLVDVAGEAARFPHHFASFLPEDEGLTGETTKTVVYLNYYLQRFFSVSLPIAGALADGSVTRVRAHEAAQILLTWFRAHDIAHSYFDKVCHGSGLQESYVHAAREILADCVGFVVASKIRGSSAEVAQVVLAEALRYARRDSRLFADAVAARFELGWLLHRASYPSLISGRSFAAFVNEMLSDTIGRLAHEDPDSFQQWIDRTALGFQMVDAQVHGPNDLIPIYSSISGEPQ